MVRPSQLPSLLVEQQNPSPRAPHWSPGEAAGKPHDEDLDLTTFQRDLLSFLERPTGFGPPQRGSPREYLGDILQGLYPNPSNESQSTSPRRGMLLKGLDSTAEPGRFWDICHVTTSITIIYDRTEDRESASLPS